MLRSPWSTIAALVAFALLFEVNSAVRSPASSNCKQASRPGRTQEEQPTWLKTVKLPQRQLQQQQLIENATVGTLGYWGASIGTHLVPDLVGSPVVAISSGWRFVIALFQNKSITAWGDDESQQLEIPIEARNGPVKAIAAGKNHGLALLESGRVIQWGVANAGNVPPEAQQNVMAIWAGDTNSFAQLNDGRIIGWGNIQSIGRVLPALQDVKYLAETAANGYVVLFNNGTLFNCTTATYAAVPSQPIVVQGVRSVAVSMAAVAYGPPHFIIVLNDNTTVAWGGNTDNRAGGANNLTNVAAVAASIHSMVLFNNGTVKGFGLDRYGEVSIPPSLFTNSPVVAVAVGDTHSVVLRADGSVFVWGRLYAINDPILPPIARSPNAIVSVSSSWYHALVLQADGSVSAFGVNFTGETGVPDVIHNSAIAISAGRNHSLVLTRAGQVVSFGALKNSDVPPAALSGVVGIAAGGLFSVALKNDSSLVVWGSSPNMDACGLTAIPTIAVGQIKQISAGDDHLLALMSDGSIRAWGCGQAAVIPSTITVPAIAVSAANQHSVVLLQTGQVVYFGNYYGVGGLSNSLSMLSGITMVTAGISGICVMTAGGQLVYYGVNTNYFDNLRLVSGTSATSVAMGAEFILAVVVPSSQSNTQPSAGDAMPSRKHALPMAAVAAIAAVVGLVGAMTVMGVLWWCKHGRSPSQAETADPDHDHLYDGVINCVLEQQSLEKPLVIPGLMFAEIFVHTTARAYSWADMDSGLNTSYAVEPGVNDTQLDKLLHNTEKDIERPEPACSTHCPVVQLTQQQLREQIQLLPDGLLGKGATAYCFKCVWPSRFGNALLAAKVLKEGSNPDISSLQSFVYEASVLESVIHPNVVRMYGYCLELPTVCLILELMPYSLKDLLYKHVQPTSPYTTVHASTVTDIEHYQSQFQPPSTTTATSNAYSLTHANTQSGYVSAHSRLSSSGGGVRVNVTAFESTSPFFNAPHITLTPTPEVPLSTTRISTTSIPTAVTVAASQEQPIASQPPTTVQHVYSVRTENSEIKPRLNMLQVLRYSSDIATGLAYLHTTHVRQGGVGTEMTAGSASGIMTTASEETVTFHEKRPSRVVHRDLKPANVMISWRGVAKLSDFGLARQHDSTTVMTSGVGAGTLPYMAPELLVASMAGMSYQNPTNRVDIYSLAMMMWEMVAGKTPWEGMNEAAVITAVISGRRPELLGNSPSLQSALTMSARASLGGLSEQESVSKTDWLMTSQPQVDVPLSELPASQDALPEFNAIIKACWHHRELKRPTAAAVSEVLNALLAKYMAQELRSSTARQSEQVGHCS